MRLILAFILAPLICSTFILVFPFSNESSGGVWLFKFSLVTGYFLTLVFGVPAYLLLTKYNFVGIKAYIMVGALISLAPIFYFVIYPAFNTIGSVGFIFGFSHVFQSIIFLLFGLITVTVFWLICRPDKRNGEFKSNPRGRSKKMKTFRFRALGIIWLVFCLTVLLSIHGIKTMYPDSIFKVWAYTLLTIAIFFFYIWLFQMNDGWRWIAILVTFSFIIGFIPYEHQFPQIYNLITNPDVKVSGLFGNFPFVAGVMLDVLFYPILTFILLLASSIKITK